MNATSPRRLSPRRFLLLRGRGLLALPALLLVLGVLFLAAAFGCSSGTVTTSTGAVVAAPVVEAQDTVADIVSEMKTAYLQASAAHDARVGTETPEVHAAHRAVLLDVKAGLQASAHALATWKAASVGAAPMDVLRPLVASGRAFLTLAVELNAMKPERAAAIRAFIDTAFPPGGAV